MSLFNCPEHGLSHGVRCLRCNPAWAWPAHYPPQPPHYPPQYGHGAPMSQGCICPPTSERTCQNPTCPRKNHFRGATASGMSAFGQDPQGLEAKPASPTAEGGDAPSETPNG